MSQFPPDSTLATIRSRYTSTLNIPCSVWEDEIDGDKISTGELVFVENTMTGENLSGGATTSPFINTILRAVTVKVPGQRIFTFAWDDIILTGNTIILEQVDELDPHIPVGIPKYRASLVENDDPKRFGLQVTCEPVKARGNF